MSQNSLVRPGFEETRARSKKLLLQTPSNLMFRMGGAAKGKALRYGSQKSALRLNRS